MPFSSGNPSSELLADLRAEMGQKWWRGVPWIEEAAAHQLSHPAEMTVWLFLWLKTEALRLQVERFARPSQDADSLERGELVAALLDQAPYEIDESGLRDRRTGDLLQPRSSHHTPVRQRG